MSQLLENIQKTEKIILENNSNAQNLQQEEKEDIVNLWNSQVAQLKSAIVAACDKKLDSDGEKISSSSSATIFDFAKSHNIKLTMIFDIEGTITPLFFVTKILFPFFIDKCESFVKKNLTEKVLKLARSTHNKSEEEEKLLSSVERSMIEVASEFIKYYRSESKSLTETSTPGEENEENESLEAFQNKLIQDSLEHTRANRKIPYMKKLQGICWHQAYLDGSIAGDLFTDLVPFLEQFSSTSSKTTTTTTNELHIYSSGSVFAQKLLLGHSRFGDLAQKFFHGYHDTVTAGMKFEAESYKKIYESISTQTTTTNANEQQNQKVVCVFFSDSMLELRAAQQASSASSSDVTFVPVFTIRPQNPKVDSTTATTSENTVEFPSIFSFAQVSEALGLGTAAACGTKFESIEKELKQIRDDVKKYSVTENEERKVF